MSNDKKQEPPPVKLTDPKQLTTIYKKNGTFDAKRKELLSDFKQSETCQNLLLKLQIMVESKVKADPSILMKNKGKVAALIQGEIVNQSSSKDTAASHINTNDNSAAAEGDNAAKDEAGILSIVDKDIQENVIDSSSFHESVKEELMDVQRKLMGISDEEFEKMKQELRAKREKKEKDALNRKLRLEKEKMELDYRNNFKIKDLANGSIATNAHRVNKVPRINLKSSTSNGGGGGGGDGGDSVSEAKVEKKKKVTKMMY
ncbi:hypothetical protein KGF57_002633 [Candida theae]|uniref:BOD1/SHG1 domain-containing protein n=1 Tax=Candida theae TaxID=1198502 RepID=A0AAD5BF44_9ASCO|nr:uncharacterized protein KGF57_002633 [Candida theae]KAI5958278.1 hypothetical protein KGF57_002633 [Candida theae]